METTAWFFKSLLVALLMPPGNGLLLLGLAGLFRRRRWAFGMAAAGALLLLLQSLPLVSGALMASLEKATAAVFTRPSHCRRTPSHAAPAEVASPTTS